MQPSLLCKGLRGAQWHLGSYDCQNLHHNTHKRGGPKGPPIPPQGLKMRSWTTKNCAAVIVQRTEGGPLGPPQSSAQWHLGSYDCQNLHHNTHKRGGPKWPPIRPQGLKMRSRTTGIFYKKKLHPFILQKNSFCSSIVLEHIYTWRNIYTSHPHHIAPCLDRHQSNWVVTA